MDRDFIIEIFSEFGPVTLRRMFGGYGVVADDVNFAMVLRDGLIFRVDAQTVAKYDAEGAKPFEYDTKTKTVVVKSYRHLPERLYDDPEELAVWAREAVGAAQRAAALKPKKRISAGSKIVKIQATDKTTRAPKTKSPSSIPRTRASKKPTRKIRQAT